MNLPAASGSARPGDLLELLDRGHHRLAGPPIQSAPKTNELLLGSIANRIFSRKPE